jgi:hypothetical protein
MKIEKLKQLNALLGQEIIITGSTALAYHGLLTMDEAKDLDVLILKPTETTKEVLARLQKAEPSAKFKEGGMIAHSFIYDGVKVDVWFIADHEDKQYLVTEDGVKVASINSIVKAKRSYNRSKDWIQLMQLARKIYSEPEFLTVLPSISNHSEDYNEA